VTINLNTTFAPGAIAVTITLSRAADWEAARHLALQAAGDLVGEKSVAGCYVTKVDADAVHLELRLAGPDANGREALRSRVMSELAKRFADGKAALPGGPLPTFS
jgi:hypothetical protein